MRDIPRIALIVKQPRPFVIGSQDHLGLSSNTRLAAQLLPIRELRLRAPAVPERV